MLTRRGLIGTLLAAPVIIRTPGLLMPIKPFVMVPESESYLAPCNTRWTVQIATDCGGNVEAVSLYDPADQLITLLPAERGANQWLSGKSLRDAYRAVDQRMRRDGVIEAMVEVRQA